MFNIFWSLYLIFCMKKMAFCITVSQVVSSSSIFSLSVLFSSLSFLKSQFVQKQNDLCKKCFLLQRAILVVTRWCLLWWASQDPRDFTRNENAKFFVFFLLDDTKCGYKTCSLETTLSSSSTKSSCWRKVSKSPILTSSAWKLFYKNGFLPLVSSNPASNHDL